METFANHNPVWDLSQPSSFSELPDDDFLALLQKQFPTSNDAHFQSGAVYTNGVNPQSVSRYSLPTMTPPSEDSDASTPNTNNNESNIRINESDDPVLKRKASEDDFDDEGPSQKNQHTSNNGKKGTSRRKSSAGGPDESRLLKRKEQNRAAQRAFRERKEKHVKDLEDKVAALEAKNDQSQSENENLRDLLSRLQHENIQLKQGSFTFSVAKQNIDQSLDAPTPMNKGPSPNPNLSRTSSVGSVPALLPNTPKPDSLTFDWGSLTSFDPSVLNVLDDSPQPTALDASMQMDFGFGLNSSYTTIASNPLFMSFAETFDSSSPIVTQSHNDPFHFGTSTWPTSPPSLKDQGSMDDIFARGYLGSQHPVDYNALMKPPPSALSPVAQRSGSTSSSSPSSNSISSTFSTPKESSSSDPEVHREIHNPSVCPKTMDEVQRHIIETGPSFFAPAALQKREDSIFGPMVSCKGTNLPKTEKSDKNFEVLSAWRTITSNPRFKDADINELCTEFTNKARCDGTKVVLEPQGVNHILQTLSKQQ